MTAISMRSIAATLAAILATGGMVLIGQEGLVSVLALAVVFLLCWSVRRYSRRDIGFTPGTTRGVLLALYPLPLIGAMLALALLTGVGHINPQLAATTAIIDWTIIFLLTLALGPVTEEGFFRGWLWASLREDGCDKRTVLLLTSLAFAIWHVPEILLSKDYSLDALQAAVILVNAAVIGATWGILRDLSGSVLTTSLCHALWNASTYQLFGDGVSPGVLTMSTTAWIHPEHGVLGLLSCALLLLVLYRRWALAIAHHPD